MQHVIRNRQVIVYCFNTIKKFCRAIKNRQTNNHLRDSATSLTIHRPNTSFDFLIVSSCFDFSEIICKKHLNRSIKLFKYIGTVWWSFWSVLSGFMSECESASTAETVCTHFWIVIVPWPYPDCTQPKLTQNSVSLSTVALPVYQSTMRSLTIVFTIFGTHNNDVQGVGTHLLFRFLHWRKIVFKIKKTDFKVKITW